MLHYTVKREELPIKASMNARCCHWYTSHNCANITVRYIHMTCCLQPQNAKHSNMHFLSAIGVCHVCVVCIWASCSALSCDCIVIHLR